MASMPRVFILFFNFCFFFVILVCFGILSHYLNIGNSQCLREGFQGIRDKDFREKFMVYAALKLSLTFLLSFLDFARISCCFHNHNTYCDVLLVTFC